MDCRTNLIERWRCPVLLLRGAHDPLQPRDFYEEPNVLDRLPQGNDAHFFDSGHFWPFEAVKVSVEVIPAFVGGRRPS
jgi:pimeloyl-ACP methyl ester carboxylesterase